MKWKIIGIIICTQLITCTFAQAINININNNEFENTSRGLTCDIKVYDDYNSQWVDDSLTRPINTVLQFKIIVTNVNALLLKVIAGWSDYLEFTGTANPDPDHEEDGLLWWNFFNKNSVTVTFELKVISTGNDYVGGSAITIPSQEFDYVQIIGVNQIEAEANGPYYGIVGTPVSFTGGASGGVTPYSWSWSFGDGGSSSQQNPTHTYTSQGSYTATLTVTDSIDDDDSDTASVTIKPELISNANGPYSGTTYNPVPFTGTASGGFTPYSWLWDFGDGDTSTQQNPQHQYSDNGNYTVSLTVTDNKGFTDVDTTYADINYYPLQVDANGPYYGTIYESIQFTGTASGGIPPYDWLWDFGDGNTSTEQNPEHQYTSTGIYTVVLEVTDDIGFSETDTTFAEIIEDPLIADANGPYNGEINEPIQFIGSAEGGAPPYCWLWDFGDGNTSYSQNPTHIYHEEGNYTVTLRVEDISYNVDFDTTYALIEKENNAPNKPSISGKVNGNVGTEYDYTIVATDPDEDDIYYYVDWGDGESQDWIGPYNSGEAIVLSHSWSSQGSYIIKAKAKDTDDAESDWGTLSITMPKSKSVLSQPFNFLNNLRLFLKSFFSLIFSQKMKDFSMPSVLLSLLNNRWRG